MRFILLILLLLAASAHADCITVQHNGTTEFVATNLGSINGGKWDFTGVCQPAPTRQLTVTLTFVPPGGAIATGADQCDNIMGRANATDPIVPFPGRPNSAPVINNFGRTSFISCKFVAPAAGSTFGWWKPTEYNYSFDLTSSISTVLGGFDTTLGAQCLRQSQSGQQLVGWTTTGQQSSLCRVVPGRTYYLSMKPTDQQQVTSGCPATRSSCVVGLSNSFGG